MTIANAIKKLGKVGEVKSDGHGRYWTLINGFSVGFLANGSDLPTNDITCEYTRRLTAGNEVDCDYSYWSNLTQAIRYASGK